MTEIEIVAGSISDHFVIENLLFSSRTADAFRGVDISRQVAVTVWLSRGYFVQNSPRMNNFIQRIRFLKGMIPPIADIATYGVDQSGAGFLVLPTLDGGIAVNHLREGAEVERRYIRILRLIDRLHTSGVVAGDLGPASFWINRSGEISLVGLFGPDPGEVGDRVNTITADASAFCAPEVLAGEGPSFRSDVYSLGVICYFLITGALPAEERLKAGSGSWLTPDIVGSNTPPIWAEEILAGCLSQNPGTRFPDAAAILRTLSVAKDRTLQDSSLPVRAPMALIADRSQQQLLVRSKPKPATDEVIEEAEPEVPKASIYKVIAVVLVSVGALLCGSFFYLSESPNLPDEPVAGSGLHQNVETDRPLKEALRDVEIDSQDVAQGGERLKSLVASNDPLAHDTLVRLALGAKTLETRRRVEEGIVDRARRLGAIRCAEEVRTWLQGIQGEVPEIYEAVLRALDQTLPQDAIERYLRQAYPKSPAVILRITAALGFDSRQISKFQPLLAQLIGDNLKLPDAKDHSAQALILADPYTSTTYADDVIQGISDIPDRDIQWLLDLLAVRRDPNVKVIAHAAIDRNLLPPGKRIFARLLRDRDDIEAAVSVSLVNAVAGSLTANDIAQIGGWYDIESEAALLGVMATAPDKQLAVEAFDNVAGKVKSNPLVVALVERVRTRYWDQRGELSLLIGMTAFPDEFSEEQVLKAMEDVDPILRQDNKFLDTLITSKDPILVRATIKHFSAVLGAGRLINLLGFPDKSVRLSAVGLLKEYNQIQLLQLILEAYKKEKDEEVRNAYRESFWFIKEREKSGSL